MKNDEKKMSFKKMIKQNMFCFIIFLNDENHTQIVSPEKKNLIRLHVLKHE